MTSTIPAAVAKIIEQMSDEDRDAFFTLLRKLDALGHDVTQLNAKDRALMARIGERNKELMAHLNGGEQTATLRYRETTVSPAILKTQFYLFVRETLLTEWCSRGGSLEDAVFHAFEQKWLPDELKDEVLCVKLFAQYQREIEQFNAFQKEILEDTGAKDKKMALGLAWFTTLFKLRALIEQGVDLSES